MSGVVEIAAKAGVSPATVSRALRGLHHVNESTRAKIVAAAMELNYPLRPDLIPSELLEKTNRIAVVAPYISRWYFAEAINGIEQSLREADVDLLLYNFSQVDARKRLFHNKKLQEKVDAIIVISMQPTDEEFKSLLGLGIPITTIGFSYPGCTSVAIDDVEGGRVAARHLIELGHKDFAILSGHRDAAYNFEVSNDRTQGFLEVLTSQGIDFDPESEIHGDFNIYTAEVAMENFLRRKKLPTAIFCHSDEMAFGALKAIRAKGLKVPEDISVIGFDDHLIAQYIGLTTVSQLPQFEGQLAASATVVRVNSGDAKPKNIVVPITLVVRDTTAAI